MRRICLLTILIFCLIIVLATLALADGLIRPNFSPSPGPEETPGIPEITPGNGLSDDENYIFQQVNVERRKAGLKPLALDQRLVKTARAKSRDMVENGYFGHTSPTLGSPSEQMRKAGISFRASGENIAGNNSAREAMNGWMRSSGHRKNILSPRFNRIGIGVVRGSRYGKIMTQQFIGN